MSHAGADAETGAGTVGFALRAEFLPGTGDGCLGMRPPASGSEWYNSHIRCALASTLERADASGRIPGVASGSRRRGICFPVLIGSIVDPTFRSNFWPSAGWDRLYSVIFEVSEDEEGEYLHLVTLVEVGEG